jgi:hypothetical protein
MPIHDGFVVAIVPILVGIQEDKIKTEQMSTAPAAETSFRVYFWTPLASYNSIRTGILAADYSGMLQQSHTSCITFEKKAGLS